MMRITRVGQRGIGHVGHVVGLGIAALFTFVMVFTTWYAWYQHSTPGAYFCAFLTAYGAYGTTLAIMAIRRDWQKRREAANG